ncbi:hypothetical protein A4249_14115 [Brevundimonas sp. GW460-12-10-14-LB2]|uniref:type II toxin-antitoxin system RelE/ParE family toxin n=1 Tax=Brevundimonas sp. GW460-12-10-14-LB2 TaxID=1827469 RepID=UPI0007BCC989|nr:type II toxin-antitoxin system RelE/ParE family toxin [Brevundimonas sp. GW460-12-10-14-LB2]ANC54677.1 hypothetical protein A4249_14115 [Brevundimonas sp. GW460-12-10-14-LB2]
MSSLDEWDLFWSEDAVEDRDNMTKYYALTNPAAAVSLNEGLQEAGAMLQAHPHSGRRGRIPDTREKVLHSGKVIIVYRTHDDVREVEIMNVVSSAQKFPT